MPDSRYPSNEPRPIGCTFPCVNASEDHDPRPVGVGDFHDGEYPVTLRLPPIAPDALLARLTSMLQRRGYSRASIARKLAKFQRGREEHGDDLYLLDYLGEMTAEADDLAVYLALWWVHGGPQTPAVVELMATVRRLEALLDQLKPECGYPTPAEWTPDPTGVSLMAATGDDAEPALV